MKTELAMPSSGPAGRPVGHLLERPAAGGREVGGGHGLGRAHLLAQAAGGRHLRHRILVGVVRATAAGERHGDEEHARGSLPIPGGIIVGVRETAP